MHERWWTATSFSGHETFPFRYPWLKKGFDAVREDAGVFQRDDAITTLGVGKNMVRSIRHWCLAAGVLEENRDGRVRPAATDLGNCSSADDGLDPYLEDPATLWLLHWQIAGNRARATTWFWTFSHFHEPEFTREALTSALLQVDADAPGQAGGRKFAEARRGGVPSHLRPVRASPRRFRRGLPRLPARRAWPDHPARRRPDLSVPPRHPARPARRHPALRRPAVLGALRRTAETLALHDIARQPGSPGRLFKIDESSLVERLEGRRAA